MCPKRIILGMNRPIERQGVFAEFVSTPNQNIYEIPNGLDKNEAPVAEPTAVSLHAVLIGEESLESVIIKKSDGSTIDLKTDFFIPLFGLSPKLGPISNWGLDIEKNAIKVNNSLDYQTNIPGVFAIGDVNTYPGKLKLILCGFHEAAMMCQSAFKILNPNKKFLLKYTTVSGVKGFDGSHKQAPKSVVKTIS